VEDILGFLIVDGKMKAKINQQAGTLEITSDADAERAAAVQILTASISDLFTAVFHDGDGYRNMDQSAVEDQGLDMTPFSSRSSGPASRGMGGRRKARVTDMRVGDLAV
jgi:COP9 signalosome complex subunit 2